MSKSKPNRIQLKQRLFDQGCQSVSRTIRFDADEELTDTYFCPLCLTGFDSDSVWDLSLTLEDVPPKALGGKPLVLTCQPCNNSAGTLLDAHAAELRRLDLFTSGVPGSTMRFRADGVSMSVTRNDDGTNLFEIIERASRPDAFREMVARFDRGLVDGLPNARAVLKLDMERAAASYVRSACLVLFALYGYRFATQECLAPVRKQIRTGAFVAGEGAIVVSGDIAGMPPRCAGRLREPEHLMCMFARFNDRIVFVPSYGSPADWNLEMVEGLTHPEQWLGQANFLYQLWPKSPKFFSDELKIDAWHRVDFDRLGLDVADDSDAASD